MYFETGQRLVPEDWDAAADIYQRADGRTHLVSTGPDQTLPTPEFPNPFVPATRFLGASPDGATAYFATAEHLTSDDTSEMTSDIFAWRDGVTTRLTRTLTSGDVPGAPEESFDPYSFAGAGAVGFVYFTARSRQVSEDVDDNTDVYRARPDGTLERAIAAPGPSTILRVGAVSRDGTRLFLESDLPLVSADRDRDLDIYMWSNGRYRLISPSGPTGDKEEELSFGGISRDGTRAYFGAWASLNPADTDEEPDVYEWNEGRVRLVSPSAEGRQAASFFMGISPNGRFVAFSSWEELLPGDNDAERDIYVIDMGTPALPVGASARSKPRKPRHRRLRLITAESIAPRMGIAPVGFLESAAVRLRLRCPRAERSGPCHGRVKLLTRRPRRVLAAGRFRIAAGRTLAVRLSGRGLPRHGLDALARVRVADLLGNRRVVSATVRLRRAG